MKWIHLTGIFSALAYILVGFLFLVSASFSAAAETPQDLLASGRVDEAMQALERQIQNSPTAEAYNLLCRAHFELDAWDAGIPDCEKATELDPTNGLYHLWLGRIYGQKADHAGFFTAAGLVKKVRKEFERAVELTPDSWVARTDLAEFYIEAPGIVGGGEDKARAQAKQIAPLNPAMAHWVMARIAEKNKDLSAAEEEYRAAIAASHDGARAWLNLAGFYRHTNRLDEMEKALHSMESSPLDHPAALVDGASLLLRSGRDYAMAIRFLRRYLSSANPASSNPASSSTVEEAPAFKAQYLLGQLLEKQGNPTAAADEYRAALAIAPSFTRARDALERPTR
jgi:tetratricopeptide (TPR) repeat protein